MKLLIILATALGISFSTGPQEVPTSLCHDPLLGPSMIIYSDCGGTQEVVDKDRSRRNNRSTGQMIEPLADESDIQPVKLQAEKVADQPIENSLKQSIELSNTQPTETITVLSIDQFDEITKVKKEKCDKGSGNGAEGCDPGNHPEKGNNDEGGDKHPQNGKKENQKCNKGSGNGAEGCDPGNHPEKGNNDEGGDPHPQNGKKDKKH